MKNLESILYGNYIIPNIEDEEVIECVSKLYQNLTPAQGKLCAEAQKLYVSKAFLLGVRTGVGLERFLNQGDLPYSCLQKGQEG